MSKVYTICDAIHKNSHLSSYKTAWLFLGWYRLATWWGPAAMQLYLMQVAAVAQLSDGLLKSLNAHRAFLLAPAHLLFQVGTLTIKGFPGCLQLPARLPLTGNCLKQFGLHISMYVSGVPLNFPMTGKNSACLFGLPVSSLCSVSR